MLTAHQVVARTSLLSAAPQPAHLLLQLDGLYQQCLRCCGAHLQRIQTCSRGFALCGQRLQGEQSTLRTYVHFSFTCQLKGPFLVADLAGWEGEPPPRHPRTLLAIQTAHRSTSRSHELQCLWVCIASGCTITNSGQRSCRGSANLLLQKDPHLHSAPAPQKRWPGERGPQTGTHPQWGAPAPSVSSS